MALTEVNSLGIKDLEVKRGDIAADAIDGSKLDDNAVDSEHIAAGAVDLEHMSSESVDEDNLHISNAGSNGQFLSKQSGNAGGLTWATVSTTPEGTAILSTGETGGTKFLREDGDNSCSWQTVSTDPTTTSGTNSFTVADGDLIIGTSGHGVSFAATADTGATGAAMSSELFEDYEEGSWTPTLAEGSATYTKCKYVRIGNMVYLNFHCDNVTDRTSTTDWRIAAASLPFSPLTDFTDNMIMGVVAHRYTSHADDATIHASMNGSGIGWYSCNDDEGDKAFSSFKHSHVDATYSAFHFSGWYYV